MNNGEAIRIYNERKGTYIRTNNENTHLEQVLNDNPGDRTVFRMIPMGTDGAFALYNPAYDCFVDKNRSNDVTNSSYSLAQFTNEPVKFYTGKQAAPNDYMSWIGTTTSKSGNNYFNDWAGSGVCSYSWNDGGSKWVIVTNLQQFKDNYALRAQLQAAVPNYLSSLELLGEEDTDNLKGWAEEYNFGGDVNLPVTEDAKEKINRIINATHNATIKVTKQAGDKFIANMNINENDAAATAWTAAINAASTVEDAYEALATLVGGRHVILRHPQRAYMGATDFNTIKRGAAEGKRIFTLEKAEGGFRMLNEYTQKYVKYPNARGQNINAVSEPEQASIFTLEYFGNWGLRIKYTGTPFSAQNKPTPYLHANASGNDVTNVVDWSDGESSTWYFSAATDEEADNEANAGANEHLTDARNNYAYSIGGGVGQYTCSDTEAYNTALAAFNAITDEASNAEKHAAAVALQNAASNATFTINMPKAGHFYRLHGIDPIDDEGHYHILTSNIVESGDNQNRLVVANTNNTDGANTDNRLETAFYFDGTHLVSVADGLVITTDGHTKTVAAATATTAETLTFTESIVNGAFDIKADTRFLHNGYDHLDSGTSAANSSDRGYRWKLSEISWLPISGSSANGWTTFQSPIELNTREGVTAYSLTFDGNYVVLTEVTNGVVPANTPVALHFQGAQTDGTTGLVYLSPRHSDAQPTGDSHLAKAKAEGVNYITLSGEEFAALTEANVPGFKAVFEANEAKTYAMVDNKLHDVLTGAEGKVYTLRSSEAGRGHLIYNEGNEQLWPTKSHDVNDSDPNYQWTMVKDGENVYLYNLGAQKFASAYAKHQDNQWPMNANVEFHWTFSDYPTAVNITFRDWDAKIMLNEATLNILGGQIGENSHGAGMMIIADNGVSKVPCVSGAHATNPQDGNGFQFIPVSGTTVNVDELHAKIAEAKEAMEAAYTELAKVKDIDEGAGAAVGYFDAATRQAYMNELNKVTDDAETEAKYYAYVRANNSVTKPGYNEFEHNGAYHLLADDEGATAYHATATKEENGTYTIFAEPKALDIDDPSFNWRATVNEEGKLTLTHTFEAPEGSVVNPRNAMRRVAAGMKEVPVDFVKEATPKYDGFGNITLPFEGNDVILRATTLEADAPTTAICEVEAAGEGNAEVIYDLQGRRLNRAVRGINIINGKKVYIK